MVDLTLETINISFTLMRPFVPQLLLPGSQPFILLEKQILQLVRGPLPCFRDWDALPATLVNRHLQLLVMVGAMVPAKVVPAWHMSEGKYGGNPALPEGKLAEEEKALREIRGQAVTRYPCSEDYPREGSQVLPYLI